MSSWSEKHPPITRKLAGDEGRELVAGAGIWDGWINPVTNFGGRPPVISHGFNPETHRGVDIDHKRLVPGVENLPWHTNQYETFPGEPILACGPGDIYFAGVSKLNNGEYGNVVIIDHHDVPGFGPLATQNTHLSTMNVKTGDHVDAGTLLGLMGNSGTKFAHLHFGCSTDVNDKWGVDPAPLLAQWGIAKAGTRIVETRPGEPGQPGGENWATLLLLWILLSSD